MTPETRNKPTIGQTSRMILATSIAAAIAGIAALYFVFADRGGEQVVKWLSGDRSLLGIESSGVWKILLPALGVAITMPLIIWLQRRFFPGTEGTGIPQAIAAIQIGDRPERKLMLSVRIAFGKILLLSLALISGITVGREGPSVHVAACCMHLSSRFCRFHPWLLQRGLILAGSAAGIAAAFNAPIAGVVFCFEEVGRVFDKDSVPTIIRTVAIACVIGVIVLGDYEFYGSSNSGAALPIAVEGGLGTWLLEMRQWIAVPVVGLIGGLLGGGFGRGVVAGSRRLASSLVHRPLRTGLVLGLALAVIGITSGGSSYGGGHAQAQQMLETAADTGVPIANWGDPIAKAAASFVSLISGIPGGLFDPSLAVGAGLGQITHGFMEANIAPGIGLPELMLLFMAAYFAGVVQSPITVFAILFEMTGAYGMVLPMMFASMIGAIVARRLCEPSIYEALADSFLEAKGVKDLANAPPKTS
ncbi:MAG: chloride channel protein [Phycisphaerales bacterium]|jgi:H+/Cl- antiporter ClcA|nr:chloride channel protein [Phycisphaerales bacterium]